MLTYVILPVLGAKNDVAASSPDMFEPVAENIVKTHCTASDLVHYNKYYTGKEDAANKTGGRTLFKDTDATISEGGGALAVFQYHLLEEADDVNLLAVTNYDDAGGLYSWPTTTGTVTKLESDDVSPVTEFFGRAQAYCSFLQVGRFIIFTAGAITGLTPWVVFNDDAVVVKLIGSGTEYGCQYLEYFQNRVFIACTYDTGLNADEIRYSNLNPTFPIDASSTASTVSFAASDQLTYPNGSRITGIKRMGEDRLFLYSDSSIAEIKYYANYATPFGIKQIVSQFGAISNDSIVEVSNAHFFYDMNNGFCVFDGLNVLKISENIRDWVEDIDSRLWHTPGAQRLYSVPGTHLPNTNEVVWYCSENTTSNTLLYYYNYKTNSWRRDAITARTLTSGYVAHGDPNRALMLADQDTVWYHQLAKSDVGEIYAAYRIEPILNMGGDNRTLINEIWIRPVNTTVGEEIDFWYRGGLSVAELEAKSWASLGSIRTDVVPPVLRPPSTISTNYRYHQIKWGSDSTGATFSIERIEFKYVLDGRF